MDGEFLLFINHKQAASFGHVGWGFKEPGRDNYLFGSTDHLLKNKSMNLIEWIEYMHVEAGDENDWWCDSGTREKMVESMKATREHIWYHAYKTIKVNRPDFEKAKEIALGYRTLGWSVFSNNCVQQTHDIAKGYGVGPEILNPYSNPFLLIPNLWLRAISGEYTLLNHV